MNDTLYIGPIMCLIHVYFKTQMSRRRYDALKATEILVFQQRYISIESQCVIRYLALRRTIKYLVADRKITPLLLYHEPPSVDDLL